ncbi:hypothetical protein SAMN04515647_1923 [Cohaesibacter sp. ES.047]|nr:hypothetical protein SAMN04515647_1923 [Cohaesibacter sp. ES.047]
MQSDFVRAKNTLKQKTSSTNVGIFIDFAGLKRETKGGYPTLEHNSA